MTLLISEYVEGESWDKAIELFNYGSTAIDLEDSEYKLRIYHNGQTWFRSIQLKGIVRPGEVFVIANPRASLGIIARSDQTHGYIAFNGNDAVVLAQGGKAIDAIGRIGQNPGKEWGSGAASTKDNTLRRRFDVPLNTSANDSFNPRNEWNGFALGTIHHLGVAPTLPPIPRGLIISKYEEGESWNKSIELFNGSVEAIDLVAGNFVLEIYSNGSLSPQRTINLMGNIPVGGKFTISHTQAVVELLLESDQTHVNLVFNGNDAIVLRKGIQIVDSFGQVGDQDRTDGWGQGDFSTVDNTLRRRPEVIEGDTNILDPFEPETKWHGVGDAFLISPDGGNINYILGQFPGDYVDLDNPEEDVVGEVKVKSYNRLNNLIELYSSNFGVDKTVHIVTDLTGPFNPPLSREYRPAYLSPAILPVQGVIWGGRTDANLSQDRDNPLDSDYLREDPTVRAVGFREGQTGSSSGKTWVVIHGWNGNLDDGEDSLPELFATVTGVADSQDRVLALDWREAARNGGLPGFANFTPATWITPVAEFAARALREKYNADPSDLILVGHSLGSYVASEIGRIYRDGLSVIPGNGYGVETIVALDPASALTIPGNGPYDLDGRVEGNQEPQPLYSVAKFSRAFNGALSPAGNEGYAVTAHEAFQIEYNSLPLRLLEEHGWVPRTFGHLLTHHMESNRPSLLGQLFGSSTYESADSLRLDQFRILDNRQVGTSGYRGIIKATQSSNEPVLLVTQVPGINGTVIIGGNEDDAITWSSGFSLTEGPDYPVNLNVGNDWIAGDGGNDTLKGFGGNDQLFGGEDDDWLLGGSGNDLLVGEEGDDLLSGGSGQDTFVIGDPGFDVIEDFSLGSTTDIIALTEGLTYSQLSFTDVNSYQFRGGTVNNRGALISSGSDSLGLVRNISSSDLAEHLFVPYDDIDSVVVV